MKRVWVGIAGALFVATAGAWYAYSPRYTLQQMKAAASSDTPAIAAPAFIVMRRGLSEWDITPISAWRIKLRNE